jgi:hypothetical protein
MIKLLSKPGVDPADADYPFGKPRDDDGSGNGLPANTLTHGDMHQFFEKLMNAAGLVANDLPDNETNGFQLFAALLKKLVSSDDAKGIKLKIIDIGAWNMDANKTKVLTAANGLTDEMVDNILSIKVSIYPDGFVPAFGSGGGKFLDYIDEVSDTGLVEGGTSEIVGGGINQIVLYRRTGGYFDNATYNDAAQNRGFAVITYWG